MVICLERGADLHMAQLMPLPLWFLASVKSRLVLPFWYLLTWVVPDQGPLNGRVYGCILRDTYILRPTYFISLDRCSTVWRPTTSLIAPTAASSVPAG